MTDIAELGLAVRSDGVVVAKDRLKDLSKEAATAERVVAGLVNQAAKLVAAYATWRVAGAIVDKFVSSTIEAERAQSRLNAVLKATGGTVGLSATQLTALATSLQRVTAYGDEAILSAETMLLTFRRIGGDVFPRATEAALDLATTMGGDLSGAAVQLGKALNDPVQGITALTRVGITFDASQKALIKTMVQSGDIAGAQTLILKELENEMGGTARAARGTLGGALTALDEAFGDLFEATGPEADTLRKSVEGLIDAITDPAFIASVQSLGAALFGAFANALPYIESIIQKVTTFFEILNHQKDPGIQFERGRGSTPMSSIPGNSGLPVPGTAASISNADLYLKKQLEKLAGGGDVYGMEQFGQSNLNSIFSKPEVSGGGAGGGKGEPIITQDQIDAIERADKAYQKLLVTTQSRIDQLKAEGEALGLTDIEAAKLTERQKLLDDAQATGKDLSAAQVEALYELADAAAEAQIKLQGLQMDMQDQTPWDTMTQNIENLTSLLQAKAISQHTFDVEMGKSVEEMVNSYANGADDVIGNVQKLTDALGLEGKKAFEVQKTLSIARAVVAGGEAIVHSYNAGTEIGGPITGAIFAGIAAAATAAQIASIASSSYESKTAPTAGAGSASATPVAAPADDQRRVIHVIGNPDTPVSARSILDQITELMGFDGKKFVVEYKGA